MMTENIYPDQNKPSMEGTNDPPTHSSIETLDTRVPNLVEIDEEYDELGHDGNSLVGMNLDEKDQTVIYKADRISLKYPDVPSSAVVLENQEDTAVEYNGGLADTDKGNIVINEGLMEDSCQDLDAKNQYQWNSQRLPQEGLPPLNL